MGQAVNEVWRVGTLLVWLAAVAPMAEAAEHRMPMFPNADSERQGFLRIINHSKIADNAIVEPCDDARPCDRISLTIDADETVHFNSDDLAMGNEDKGLSRGVGSGTGDWNLRVVSALNLEVLAYVRTQDGFLPAMHDVVEREEDGHYRVANFNPGRNEMQASLLRLPNPNGRTVEVAIAGIDDKGLPSESVRVALFPAAGDSSGRQGFVRVINHSAQAAEVVVRARQHRSRSRLDLA